MDVCRLVDNVKCWFSEEVFLSKRQHWDSNKQGEYFIVENNDQQLNRTKFVAQLDSCPVFTVGFVLFLSITVCRFSSSSGSYCTVSPLTLCSHLVPNAPTNDRLLIWVVCSATGRHSEQATKSKGAPTGRLKSRKGRQGSENKAGRMTRLKPRKLYGLDSTIIDGLAERWHNGSKAST